MPIVASVCTPYQLLFVERLLALVPPRPTLIIDQRPVKFRGGRAVKIPHAEVVEADITGSVRDAGQQRLMRSMLDRAEQFSAGRPFVFVSPSFGWSFNNVALAKWRARPDVHFVMSEDGLSTYLATTPSWKWWLRNAALEAVGRLRGNLPRVLYRGHPLGLDLPEVEAIFVGSDLVVPPGDVRYVPLPPSGDGGDTPRDASRALFVGQPYLRDYGQAAIEAFIGKVRVYLAEQGISRIDFKPHHFQTEEEVGLYLAHGFTLLDPPVTIEEMVGESDHGVIVSANTTALMTAKSMLGPALRSIAINPTKFAQRQETRDPEDVAAVFRRFGVEIVDL